MGITVECQQCGQTLEEWEAGRLCEGCGAMSTKEIRLSQQLMSHIIGLLKESGRIRVIDSDGGTSIGIEFDGEPWTVKLDVKLCQD